MNFIAQLRERLEQIKERAEPFKLHLLAMSLVALLGISVGLVKALSPPPKVASVDRWALPQWAPFQAAATRQQLANLSIFAPDPNTKKANDMADSLQTWRFTGTVREGNQQVALIEVDKGQHIRRVLSGDLLPNGAKVTAIHTGDLVYTDSVGEQVLKLFNSDTGPSAVTSRKK